MEVNSLIAIVSLVVLISVHSSDGINCWVCTSATETKCGTNFDATGMTSTQCPGDVSCVIITSNNVVARSCFTAKQTERCTTATVGGVSAETCYCNTDECTTAASGGTAAPGGGTAAPGGNTGGNAAGIPTVSLLATALGVLLKLIF